MIKVFTTDNEPNNNKAGDDLTSQFNSWIASNEPIEIISIHTNSNSYGWMLTILYK
jgi:hypothetical protein